MNYEAVIGLEVHVQLRTQSKLFCGCKTSFGDPPNTNVCPVCLGYPGAMPVVNEEAVRSTVIAGLMIGSRIHPLSRFDRKSYFYPDMPKNYQISQYDRPLCIGGSVSFATASGGKTVQITRIHLEEDVAKNTHFAGTSGVDFNRAGTPLMEIVTEPDLSSADDALAFLLAMKQILVYSGVSECNLEQGNLRCDVNCSVRPVGTQKLGTKIEIKNMNTFKGVHAALLYEIDRQVEAVRSGVVLVQETRRWNPDIGQTEQMRTKEEAHDYRYFPEPDLMPVAMPESLINELRSNLPELPQARRLRFVNRYGIPDYDAGVLTADKPVADFFETAAGLTPQYKALSNWIMTELLRHLSETGLSITSLKLTPQALADLVDMVEKRILNSNTAKDVFGLLLSEGGDPRQIVEKRGLAQVSDTGAIDKFIAEAIAGNAKSVEAFKSGKRAALQHLMGQVMKMSKGKADPKLVMDILEKRLSQ